MTHDPHAPPPDRSAAARRERRIIAGMLALATVAAAAVVLGDRLWGAGADRVLVWVAVGVVMAMAAFVVAVALFFRATARVLAPNFFGFVGAVGIGFFVADEVPPVWRAALALAMTVLAAAALWGVWFTGMGAGGRRRR